MQRFELKLDDKVIVDGCLWPCGKCILCSPNGEVFIFNSIESMMTANLANGPAVLEWTDPFINRYSDSGASEFDLDKLPEMIIELREKAGLTQVAMAKILGIKGNGLNQYEHGSRKISMWTVQKYADHFDFDVAILIKPVSYDTVGGKWWRFVNGLPQRELSEREMADQIWGGGD